MPISFSGTIGTSGLVYIAVRPRKEMLNMKNDKDVEKQLERLNTEDYIDRIDAIMDVSNSDDEKIVHKLIEIAVSAMRGEVRVAAAVGLCEHQSDKRIELLERYLSVSDGYMLSGGDPKATVALILAVMNGGYNLEQVLEKHPDVKSEVLEYLGKADRDHNEINSGMDQIAYFLTWCAGIYMGCGDRSFIEYVGHKSNSSKKLVSSIIEWM